MSTAMLDLEAELDAAFATMWTADDVSTGPAPSGMVDESVRRIDMDLIPLGGQRRRY